MQLLVLFTVLSSVLHTRPVLGLHNFDITCTGWVKKRTSFER